MLNSIREIEKIVFVNYIQSNTQFIAKNEKDALILKEGRLLNFNIKLPFIHFRIEVKDRVRDFYLPYPYNYGKDDYGFYLSYVMEDMCSHKKIIDKLLLIGNTSESKIFNRKVYLINNESN